VLQEDRGTKNKRSLWGRGDVLRAIGEKRGPFERSRKVPGWEVARGEERDKGWGTYKRRTEKKILAFASPRN